MNFSEIDGAQLPVSEPVWVENLMRQQTETLYRLGDVGMSERALRALTKGGNREAGRRLSCCARLLRS